MPSIFWHSVRKWGRQRKIILKLIRIKRLFTFICLARTKECEGIVCVKYIHFKFIAQWMQLCNRTYTWTTSSLKWCRASRKIKKMRSTSWQCLELLELETTFLGSYLQEMLTRMIGLLTCTNSRKHCVL